MMQVAGPILNTESDISPQHRVYTGPLTNANILNAPIDAQTQHAINAKLFASTPVSNKAPTRGTMSRSTASSSPAAGTSNPNPNATPNNTQDGIDPITSNLPSDREDPQPPGPAHKRPGLTPTHTRTRSRPRFDLSDEEDEDDSGGEESRESSVRAPFPAQNGDSSREEEEESGGMEDTPRPSISQQQQMRIQQEQEQQLLTGNGSKRWNALMEIVHTEAGYVHDLRALVNVYFVVLPTIQIGERALEAVNALGRSGLALLRLHERFLGMLQEASAAAVHPDPESEGGDVEEAIRSVARLFIVEAPTFDLYQEFCSAQPDALRLLRPTQARPDWETFEHICARLHHSTSCPSPCASQSQSQSQSRSSTLNSITICNTSDTPTSSTSPSPSPFSTLPSKHSAPPSPGGSRVPRTLSLVPTSFRVYGPASFFAEYLPSPVSPTSEFLALHANVRSQSYDSGLARALGSRPSSPNPNGGGVFVPSSLPSPSKGHGYGQRTRLRFQDYLIKPIQRICKYPLMLEGLKRRGGGGGTEDWEGDRVVERAVESMKGVAARVDEARRQKEAEEKTHMILERLDGHNILSVEFLHSLGTCILAGSLDVVHHHHILEPVTPTMRVRYFGAFLFAGGYVLLVKVCKGPVYRLKHWFALASFELVDIPPEKAIVPHSFRLSCVDHHYELAAASEAEKFVWIRAMKDSLKSPASWIAEPVPSFHVARPSMPTSPSLGDLKPLEPLTPMSAPSSRSSSSSRLSLRLSGSRRRSSLSNPAQRLFSFPIESTTAGTSSVLLRRSSKTERDSVERDLGDVQTNVIASLRAHAVAKEEVLFPGVKYPVGSNNGNGNNNKLLRRGSSQSQSGTSNTSEDTNHHLNTNHYISTINGNANQTGKTSYSNSLKRALSSAGGGRGKLVRPRPLLMLATSNSAESAHEEIPEMAGVDEDGASMSSGVDSLKRSKSFAGSLRGFMMRATTMRRSSVQSDDFDVREEDATSSEKDKDQEEEGPGSGSMSPPAPSPHVTFATTSPRYPSKLALGSMYDHEKRRSASEAVGMGVGVDAATKINRRKSLKAMLFT
ncbi:hypothetical protein M422DRAFT_238656 [Sphaerobolus stellatus SS14]|nr:hypothetical protein M422DRAFT_238656 [Sphaerobolus stellatus SS14]